MKRKATLIIGILVFSLFDVVIAQGKFGITAKADLVSPPITSYLVFFPANEYKWTTGYLFMLHYRVDSIEVTATSGIYRWKAQPYLNTDYVYTNLPLLLGTRYYVDIRNEDFKPYVGVEFGLNFTREESFLFGKKQSHLSSNFKAHFGSGISVGTLFSKERNSLYLDFHLKYSAFVENYSYAYSNSNQIVYLFAVSVGIRVDLKK